MLRVLLFGCFCACIQLSSAAPRSLLAAASQCSRAGQFVADTSTSCTKFWQCTGPGQGNYQTCNTGTAFDVNGCNCCNFPSAFTCGSPSSSSPGTISSPAISPPPPTPSNPTSTTSSPSTSSTPASGSPPSASACTAAGQFIPDTSAGCSKFWQCTGSGQGAYQSCNTGLIFDTSCNCCNFPNGSNCKGSSSASSSPSPPAGTSSSPALSSSSPPPPPSGSTSSSGSGSGVGAIITSDLYAQIFKHTNDAACKHPNFYTYQSFISAAAAFPSFGTSKDSATNKREVAAFLAQISHETTGGPASNNDYSWGLCFDEENNPSSYCDASSPCNGAVSYHGRGPIQLSWNYNYIPAGQDLGFDGLNRPDMVLSDATLAWKTAIRFWMTPAGNKPSCHAVMNGDWQPSSADTAAGRQPGFGTVTNVINGGVECSHDSDQQTDRVNYFKRYVNVLGTDTGPNLSCSSQQHF